MKYTTIIFDLDGTLLNTLADLAAATNHALAEHKLPQRTTDEVRLFVGNGIRKLIERAVPANTPAELQEKVFASFNKYYKHHCADSTRPYEGWYRSFCSSCVLQAAVQPLFPTKRITAYRRWLSNTLTAWARRCLRRARRHRQKACARYAAGNHAAIKG